VKYNVSFLFFIAMLSFVFLLTFNVATASLLNPNDPGFDGNTRGENYDDLIDALYAGNAISHIDDALWVPWFTTSSSCTVNDLHQGNSCASGQSIDFENNCMVTDELSQVGLLIAMGNDEQRMIEYHNTLTRIESNFGKIPAWRIYRNGNNIHACHPDINGNCDTASDATARIIISLFTASANEHFSAQNRQVYHHLASELAEDFLQYEILHDCKPSSLGQGNICYWLAAGSQAKIAGMSSTDFGYTGYYADAIIAMLQTCVQTQNDHYCHIADQLTLNYLEASKYDGTTFSVPPGRSFRWVNLNGIPQASCTNTCSPVQWDSADAVRALSMCQAKYYADEIGHEFPLLNQYCQQWKEQYMMDPTTAPIQYYPNGNPVGYQSGYFAQGLQSLLLLGGNNQHLFEQTLDEALAHYAPQTKTWDWTPCFGVYTQAFPMRALGVGLGRDLASFTNAGSEPRPEPTEIGDYQFSCTVDDQTCTIISDEIENDCRTIISSTYQGTVQVKACMNSDTVDVYLQGFPRQGEVVACVGDGCLVHSAFASFPVDHTEPPSGIAGYEYSCTVGGGSCTLLSDETSGVCRTVVSSTPFGNIQILGCQQANNVVEVYRQEYPLGVSFQACLHVGCVDEIQGFASFVDDGSRIISAPGNKLEFCRPSASV